MNGDNHAKAKSLDARGGDMQAGFDAGLMSYGKAGGAIGPSVEAFGEMSSDVHAIAKAVAGELALEHCGFNEDSTLKGVNGFFSTSSTDPGDSRPTVDGRVSYWTAGALCRFPMRPAVVPG